MNHGSLIFSSSLEPGAAGVALLELGVDLRGRAALDERAVDAAVDRQLRQPAELGVGPEQQHVDARDHLRDVLVGDVGQVALAEVGERDVGAVAEQQELEVVLPHQVAAAQRPAVGVEELVERGVPVVARASTSSGSYSGRSGTGKVGDLGDQRLHLVLPLGVELVPVLEVVAGAPLEVLDPLGDLRRGR